MPSIPTTTNSRFLTRHQSNERTRLSWWLVGVVRPYARMRHHSRISVRVLEGCPLVCTYPPFSFSPIYALLLLPPIERHSTSRSCFSDHVISNRVIAPNLLMVETSEALLGANFLSFHGSHLPSFPRNVRLPWDPKSYCETVLKQWNRDHNLCQDVESTLDISYLSQSSKRRELWPADHGAVFPCESLETPLFSLQGARLVDMRKDSRRKHF